jgi:hypothetical protein
MERTAEAAAVRGTLRVWLGGARGLLNADLKGQSDPYAVLTARSSRGRGGPKVEVHRTRVVHDCLDPTFNEWCALPLPPAWANALQRARRRSGGGSGGGGGRGSGEGSGGDAEAAGEAEGGDVEDIEVAVALYDHDEVCLRIQFEMLFELTKCCRAAPPQATRRVLFPSLFLFHFKTFDFVLGGAKRSLGYGDVCDPLGRRGRALSVYRPARDAQSQVPCERKRRRGSRRAPRGGERSVARGRVPGRGLR